MVSLIILRLSLREPAAIHPQGPCRVERQRSIRLPAPGPGRAGSDKVPAGLGELRNSSIYRLGIAEWQAGLKRSARLQLARSRRESRQGLAGRSGHWRLPGTPLAHSGHTPPWLRRISPLRRDTAREVDRLERWDRRASPRDSTRWPRRT